MRSSKTLVNVLLKEYNRGDLLHISKFSYLRVIWVMLLYLFLCVYMHACVFHG
jgi:hypothetical protein